MRLRLCLPLLLFFICQGIAQAYPLPNDPLFSWQWAFRNTGQTIRVDRQSLRGAPGADISLLPAWQYSQGAGVTVGVIDQGVWLDHREFRGHSILPASIDLPSLPSEPASWNFSFANSFLQPGQHGSHVAGIIAASSNNNYGGVGVAPQAQILSMQVLNDNDAQSGWFKNQDVRAIAAAMKAAGAWDIPVANMSLEDGVGARNILAAAQASPNTLFVAAAGNEGFSLDKNPVYPCVSTAPNILCVGSSGPKDLPSRFSNYSKTQVDLFAPGENIYSTSLPAAYNMYIPKGFQYMSGTSMATPMVSGVAALMKSANPNLTPAQIKRVLIATVDHKTALKNLCVSGGRLNALRAVRAVLDPDHDGVLAIDEAGWQS